MASTIIIVIVRSVWLGVNAIVCLVSQAFAEFTDMEYFEAELAQNTIGAEKAISTLVRRIVHETDQATGKPTKSRRVSLIRQS